MGQGARHFFRCSVIFLVLAIVRASSDRPLLAHSLRAFKGRRSATSMDSVVAVRDAHAKLARHPVDMPDIIEMTHVGEIIESPSQNRFVVLIWKGNLQTDTNDYSLLLFDTAAVFQSPAPRVLISFSSSSNRPAIQQVRWIDDESLSFLGENRKETTQLYRLDCNTKRLVKLTNHDTGILSYAMDAKDHEIFFTAEPEPTSTLGETPRRYGIVVQDQDLLDLLSEGKHKPIWSHTVDLFFQMGDNSTAAKKLEVTDAVLDNTDLSLSPDGRFLVFNGFLRRVPENWKEYDDRFLQEYISHKETPDYYSIERFTLFDAKTGKSSPLINAPARSTSQVAWLSDSHSVVLVGTYLPLDVLESTEKQVRKSSTFAAEITLPDQQIVPILQQQEHAFVAWDPHVNELSFRSPTNAKSKGGIVTFQKSGRYWVENREMSPKLEDKNAAHVEVEQNMNRPPQILVVENDTGRESLLFDPNPQFDHVNWGRVEELTFKGKEGSEVKAGLYYPPDYQSGKRYPLVIQTHGWNPRMFWPDGPFASGYAAQPLAAKGIVVAQLNEDMSLLYSSKEGPAEVAALEGVVDYLYSRGVIDRERVGLMGFSRTAFHVKYALTHSSFRFAAASVSAGFDGGYFQYIALMRSHPAYSRSIEAANGGLPFDGGLASWGNNSPEFNLDKVDTPVRIIANGRETLSLILEWAWFAGLSRLDKPVEMVYLPEADHIIVRPWERLVAQQGNVDWFRFWLQGEEDPDPAKSDQYSRWREMYKRQAQNHIQSKQCRSTAAN